MKKVCKVVSIIFSAIALIGLISFAAGTRGVNMGAFIFPAAIAAAVFIIGKQR